MNGVLLSSEVDETGTLAFWVLLPALEAGDHLMHIYSESSDENLFPPNGALSEYFAVFHAPHATDSQGPLGPPVSTAVSTQGLFNSATQFDGTNYVIVPDVNQKLDTLSPTLSITAWIKPEPGMGMFKIIASRQLAGDSRDDFAFGLANGKLESAKALPQIAAITQNDLVIGGNQNETNESVQEHFFGIIDELRLTTAVLSPDTILTQWESHSSNFFVFGQIQKRPD